MGYTLIFLSVFSFALSNCLWIYPLKRLSFLEVIIIRSLLTSVLFWVLFAAEELGLIPQLYTKPTEPQSLTVVYSVLLCVFSFFGLYFYVKSLKAEKVGIAVPVSNISSFFGVAVAVFFLGEQVHFTFYISFLLAFAGVMLVNNKPVKSFRFTRGVHYNLLAAFFWGVSFALFVIPVKALGAVLFSAILEITVFLCSIFLFYTENKKWFFPVYHIDKSIIALALLGFGGVIFYNLSFLYLPVSTISLLSTITPAFSVLFATILFRERLRLWQYVGVVTILLGLLLIHL